MADEKILEENVQEETTEIVSDVKNEFASISENTKFVGNINTDGHLTVAGTVIGDIFAKGNVIICGTYEGNIECDNIIIDSAKVKATIKAKGNVQIKEGSVVLGQLYAANAAIFGKMQGNIDALSQVIFYKNSEIIGDISAKELGSEPGAKVSGKIQIG